MAWHYVRGGSTQGPVDLTELQRLHQQGVVEADTPVWTEGMTNWTPYHQSPAASNAGVLVAGARTCVECGKSFPESEMLEYEGRWVCGACKPLFFQRIKEGVAQPGALVYASIWRRFFAILIDGIILYIVEMIPSVLVGGVVALTPSGKAGLPAAALILLSVFNLVLQALYEILLIGKFGATFGKMALRIKVVTSLGGPVTYGQSTGRYFAKILSGLILAIGYLMAIWDPEKRALHDRLCDTRVVSSE